LVGLTVLLAICYKYCQMVLLLNKGYWCVGRGMYYCC